MKKRLLSAFLAVMMVLTMAPVAFAADDVEPTDGTGSSEAAPAKTLQGQINEAENGATITLNDNYTEDITIPADKVITLNLNGNKLTNVQSDTITVTKGAKLTIEGAGTVDNVTHGMAAIYNNGTTTLNGGTYTRSLETGDKVTPKNSYYNILNHGIMTIDKDVTVKQNGNYSSLVANGYYNYSATEKGDRTAYIESVGQDAPQLTINNGTFSGGINTIKNDDNAILTINNGEFSNVTQAVVQNNNIATVNGGTFNAPNYHVLENRKFNGNYNAGELTVTGGNFTGSIMVTSGATTSITGGTFSSDVAAYAATGYKAVELNGKTVVVVDTADTAVAELSGYKFTTVQNAIDAATDNDTVKLLSNVREDITITDKVITLDMDGKSLTLPSDCGVSVVGASSKLTITGNGVMNCEKTPIAVSEGTVVIENGTITSAKDYCTYAKNGGTIIVNDGILTSQYAVLTGNNTTGNMNFIVNGGTLTAKGGPAIYQSGQCELTITGGILNGGISLRMGQVNISGGTINAATENLDMPGKNVSGTNTPGYAYSGNIWFPDALYVIGGTYTSKDSTYSNSLNLNITGGTFNCTNGQGSAVAIYDLGHTAQAEKITISGDAKFATNCTTRDAYQVVDFEDLGVKPITGYGKTDLVGKVSTAISGGYFTTDPSDYVASGYVAGTSDVSGYSYKVVAKTNTGSVEVKPDVADPEVKVDKIPQADKEKVAAAAATVSAPTLGAETGDIVKDINEDTAKTLIEKATTVQGNNKKLYVQSSLKVEPTAYNETTKTLTLDITPQYRIVASTAATADGIELGDNGKNAEVVQDYTPMNITKATVVTMELPTGFAVADGDKLSIQHTKSNDKVEYYTGTVTKKDDKFYLTFTTNGFSPFVISVPAASIGENVYPTLQAAADAAKSTDVISVKSGASHELNFTTTKSVKVKNDTGVAITVKFNGTNKDVAKDATETFSYTKPSSGGSSGGSSSGKTTYKVTTSAVNNGGVNASPSSAEKGATITITLSPDKGYKLDKLTVTDGSGKTVSTVKKSDTVYTFTMPASAVKVGVSYVKATETPSETKFNDVSANDWFASAVDYVTGKGMMNGTADNTFSPKANTTRGMVVTVLYRLENQPSTSAASFTDVASGAYYANAVAWANANGIVSGYGSGKFGPNDKVTREQLAAILYRYAQYKKYDVSVGEDTNILSYNDAQSISSYAIPAIQWACGAGVVTGKSGSKLDPKGNATRAEVAAMLMRFCENVK